MEAKEAKILSGFLAFNGPQYIIPVYQRHYTWDTRNVLQLLNDIHNLLCQRDSTHFIGNIVYVRKGEDGFHEREIVDGQQRITTLFLMLIALRDLAFEYSSPDEAKDIEVKYLFNAVPNDYIKFKNKLKPNLGDGYSLRYLIERDVEGLRGNRSAICRNYLTIKSILKSWISEENYTIQECLSAIDSLMIVWVALSNKDNAQQIFESINSTGEPLTATDLIRNYILMNKSDEEQTAIFKQYWTKIEDYVCPNASYMPRKNVTKKLEEFFRFFISSFICDNVKKDHIYLSFKEYWENWKKEQDEEKLLSDLVRYSRYWNNLFNAANPPSELKNAIFLHRAIASNMPTPFLLATYNLFDTGVISANDFNSALNLIDIFLIRRHMNGLDTSSLTRMFPSLFKNVSSKCQDCGFDNFIEVVKFCLVNAHKNNAMFMPNDEQTMVYLSSSNAYTLQHTKTFFSILESSIMQFSTKSSIKDNPIPIDVSALTVEHIMPQEATSYWLERVDDAEKYEYYANLLGNLTLADKKTNTRMSNRDFEYKKNALKSVGRINMNVEFFDLPDWTFEEIKNRTDVLAKKFIETFPYFESSLSFPDDDDEMPTEFEISFVRGDLFAEAIMHIDGKVDILAGSKLRKCDNRKAPLQERLYKEIDKENISDRGDYFCVEDDLKGFSSISNVTDFVYGGSNNGWILWEDDSGNIINDSIRPLIEKGSKDLF